MLDVFFAPGEAMASLARNPRCAMALVLITAVTLLTTAVAFERGVIEHGLREKLNADSRLAQRPEAEREAFVEQAIRSSVYYAFGAAALGPAAGLLITSAVLLLSLKVSGDMQTRFIQMLAVVAHAWLPAALHTLMSIPVLLVKAPETIDFENMLPMSNLSFLFSPTEQHRLYSIASSLDLFSFWVIALLTLGLARLSGRSKGVVLTLVTIPWIGYVAIFKGVF